MLLSAKLAVIFPASEHHRQIILLGDIGRYVCEQLAQSLAD